MNERQRDNKLLINLVGYFVFTMVIAKGIMMLYSVNYILEPYAEPLAMIYIGFMFLLPFAKNIFIKSEGLND